MNTRKTALFRQTLAATGCLAAAARAAEISLEAARRLRAQPVAPEPAGPDGPDGPGDAAKQLGRAVAALEAEAVRRALSGVEVPVFHQGRECGSTVKHSDTLLMFLLKTLKPERYGGPSREAPEPGDADPGEAERPPVGMDLGLGEGMGEGPGADGERG